MCPTKPAPAVTQSTMKNPSYDLRECTLAEVRGLCAAHHGYKSAGAVSAYAFGVYEDGELVAGYSWHPPPPGAAKNICPEAPQGVLALSRMVAIPRESRRLNHVSKPLRRQMRVEIDRGRWPVLVTYSDEGQGHTGHVYKCSGWRKTLRTKRPVYERDGVRASPYSNGVTGGRDLERVGETYIQRWEHWACDYGDAMNHMNRHGWFREPIPGKVWRSGNQAYRFVWRPPQMGLILG